MRKTIKNIKRERNMKYLLVIGDGMADNPVEELSGRTPLECACKPMIDYLAANGETGSVRTVPEGVAPGSDTAILSIFGYDPRKYYTGRAPLEAAGAGVDLKRGDIAYRCNVVSLKGDNLDFEDKIIVSHSAGSIDGESSYRLMKWLTEQPEFKKLADRCELTGGSVENKVYSFHIDIYIAFFINLCGYFITLSSENEGSDL